MAKLQSETLQATDSKQSSIVSLASFGQDATTRREYLGSLYTDLMHLARKNELEFKDIPVIQEAAATIRNFGEGLGDSRWSTYKENLANQVKRLGAVTEYLASLEEAKSRASNPMDLIENGVIDRGSILIDRALSRAKDLGITPDPKELQDLRLAHHEGYLAQTEAVAANPIIVWSGGVTNRGLICFHMLERSADRAEVGMDTARVEQLRSSLDEHGVFSGLPAGELVRR